MKSNQKQKDTQALNTLERFLREDCTSYQQINNSYLYEFEYPSQVKSLLYFVELDLNREEIIFYIAIPIRVSIEHRSEIAEYIIRANQGLRIGNFEMDYDEGKLKYKTSLYFKGEILTLGFIRNTFFPAIKTVEQYSPGLALIIRQNQTAKQAIQQIEHR